MNSFSPSQSFILEGKWGQKMIILSDDKPMFRHIELTKKSGAIAAP